ncbi:DNA cytosine methyltransferase [Loktanella sp. M215]|uniref:DNA cytosine methyltransferase n=1 Tax=Loktanella sp. M215 TaxID=2675431 RepID=UPI003FA55956
MGYDDSFRIPVSDTQAYKQFGNSVAVPVFCRGGPPDAAAHSVADRRAGPAQSWLMSMTPQPGVAIWRPSAAAIQNLS